MMKIPSVRTPSASMYNKEQFIAAWYFNYGGTVSNAFRVWQVECLKNLKRDLHAKFPSTSCQTSDVRKCSRCSVINAAKARLPECIELLNKGTNADLGEYLTVKDVSNLLRVSVKDVKKWQEEGVLPHLNIDGAIRFPRENTCQAERTRRLNDLECRLRSSHI